MKWDFPWDLPSSVSAVFLEMCFFIESTDSSHAALVPFVKCGRVAVKGVNCSLCGVLKSMEPR